MLLKSDFLYIMIAQFFMLFIFLMSLYYDNIMQLFLIFSWGISSFFLVFTNVETGNGFNDSFLSYLFAVINFAFIPYLRSKCFKIVTLLYVVIFCFGIYITSIALAFFCPDSKKLLDCMTAISILVTTLPLMYAIFSYIPHRRLNSLSKGNAS